MEEAAALAEVCRQFYEPTDSASQKEAELQLVGLLDNPMALRLCQQLLETCEYPYAQVVALNTLSRVTMLKTATMTSKDRLEIKNYLLDFLIKRPNLPHFIIIAAIKLYGVVTKVGWGDRAEGNELGSSRMDGYNYTMRTVQDDISKFVQHSDPAVNTIGVQLLNALVQEMNRMATEMPTRSLSFHVKISASFREIQLFNTFKLSWELLKEVLTSLKNNQANMKLVGEILKLSLSCLSYDFIGTSSDESNDEANSIQVPTTWRSAFLQPDFMNVYFQTYFFMPPDENRHVALSCIIQLASVRRSLFANTERGRYLTTLVQGICSILDKYSDSLADSTCYHEFCRLLARLKSNYQLAELVDVENYPENIVKIAQFTVLSLRQWKFSSNSIHYLLALWQRLIASMPYVKAHKPHNLEICAPEITLAYIDTRLNGCQTVLTEECDDPLDDTAQIHQQLDQFATICRCDYTQTVNKLVTEFDKSAEVFQKLTDNPNSDAFTFRVEEAKLTWIVYLIGASIGGRVSFAAAEDFDVIDGQLIVRVLTLFNILETLISKGRPASEKLAISQLYFFENFRKIYITDSAPRSVYDVLSKEIGVEDDSVILAVMLRKIVANLKIWSSNEVIITRTLNLFNELSLGYSSIRKLLKLEDVQFILYNHSGDNFPFLGPNSTLSDQRLRTTFYSALSRLIMGEMGEENEIMFDRFIQPIDRVAKDVFNEFINTKGEIPQNEEEAVKKALLGMARDLRGICQAFASRSSYIFLWNWMYDNKYCEMFIEAIKKWPSDYRVSVPILKMFTEFAHNRSQRIQFDSCSPGGFLLFKEVGKAVCIYVDYLLSQLPESLAKTNVNDRINFEGKVQAKSEDVYKFKLKGFSECFHILRVSFAGGYCCFGVFGLYGDNCLNEIYSTMVKMMNCVTKSDMLAFPKLRTNFYNLMEALCQDHMGFISSLDKNTFIYVLSCLNEGLTSGLPDQSNMVGECATALECITAHLFKEHMRAKERGDAAALMVNGSSPILNGGGDSVSNSQKSIAYQVYLTDPAIYHTILRYIMQIILYEDTRNQWTLSRPLLPLVLMNASYFKELEARVLTLFPIEKQESVTKVLSGITDGIEMNLSAKNRERFAQNVSLCRRDFQEILAGRSASNGVANYAPVQDLFYIITSNSDNDLFWVKIF